MSLILFFVIYRNFLVMFLSLFSNTEMNARIFGKSVLSNILFLNVLKSSESQDKNYESLVVDLRLGKFIILG